jgi:mRNA interferase RelE/StbE
MYELFLTREAERSYQRADPALARRLNRCFDQLQQNPNEHPNIKRLRESLAGYFRYRVGDWRVIYSVDEDKQQITVLSIVHRSKAYR